MREELLDYLKGKTLHFCVLFVTVFYISAYITTKSIDLNTTIERTSTKEELFNYVTKGEIPQDEEEN